MKRHTVSIISDRQTDHLLLAASLERATPERFQLASLESIERPLEALMDPAIDVVIMSYGPESEYLLRLAQRHESTTPIIVLLDEAPDELITKLDELGAQDFMLRGQLQDNLIHRILDYGIQLKQAHEKIQQLANRDGLTGALNRIGFREHLQRAMERSQRYQLSTALLYINIDQFAHINDHYGERDGDTLIQTLCHRLVSKLRSTDSIARLGGDEFAIILEDVNSAADINAIGEKMLSAISTPMTLSEQQVSVEASIGGALYPEDSGELAELIENSRCAMQQAKAVSGGKFVHFSERIAFDESGSSSLAGELRTAMRKNQFEMHYQPRVDLHSGQLVGLEALLRWNHPERGILCPGEFIHACEDMGLMKTIGYQVIQHACSAQVWLAEQNLSKVDIAVNISFSQMQDDRFLGMVKDIIQRSGANPERLEFELTESTILKSPEAIRSRIEELRRLGISFSLDDFGTGFSQLSHLTELPISALKIDASFVRNLPHNPQQEAVCTMIIEMAHRLGMKVIAEGAETHEQVEFLREQDCQQVQGFYYSPAIPLQQLPRFVQQQRFVRRQSIIS